jgi:hypothetical protein
MRYWNRALLLLACAAVAQASIVVPNSLANTEGGGNNNLPFDSTTSERYQQVYLASQFGSGGLITQIAFRPDGILGLAFSVTIANIQIDLSTTAEAPDGLSTTFADNVGPDDTTVFSGALTLSSSDTGPAGGPKAFDIIINLTTPFLYNPASGNLLLDVRNFSGLPSGAAGGFDSQSTLGDPISRVFSDSTTNSVGDATGAADTEGLVTSFAITPEPASVGLLAMGLFLVVVGRAFRRRA